MNDVSETTLCVLWFGGHAVLLAGVWLLSSLGYALIILAVMMLGHFYMHMNWPK